MTGTYLTFLPFALCSRTNTIPGVRSKKPMSFFQLIPNLQCSKPINGSVIPLPQEGQTLLLLPFSQFPELIQAQFALQFFFCGQIGEIL